MSETKNALIDIDEVELDVPAVELNNRVLVPLRFVAVRRSDIMLIMAADRNQYEHFYEKKKQPH